MPDVVWISPYPPDLDGGGGQIRQARLLRALAGRARLSLVVPGPVVDQTVTSAIEHVVTLPAPERAAAGRFVRRIDDLVGSLPHQAPREVRALRQVRKQMITALAELPPPDIVLVEFAGLAPLADEVRSRWASSRSVLTLHNLTSRMAAHQAAVMPGRRQRWLFRRDVSASRRLESEAVTAFDRVIVTSDADRLALGEPSNVAVVPNGVDLERYRLTDIPAGKRLVFTGALYTAPNTDAAIWLATEILPIVRQEEPDAQIDIVGASPPPRVVELGRLAGVTVHADVRSVMPYLRAATVAVVPIRIGSGTRLKAMEAWSAGRPVVGTSIGLEGLHAVPGEHALVADDARSFAASIINLLREPDTARRLALSGHALAVKRWSWPQIEERFLAVVLS